MFIRTKKIKGFDYAYLVRNLWRKRPKGGKKGSRQKVSKYLGKVYRFESIGGMDFLEVFKIEDIAKYIGNRGRIGVVKDLIKLELMNIGFREESGFLINNELGFDLGNLTFSKDNKAIKAVIEMNEGHLCKDTISRILSFKQGDEEREGYNLARAFVDAGLKVPEGLFIGYYRKYYGL